MTNPYEAPQTELRTSKPKVIYVNKFNGKLAFWSGLAIGAVLLFLCLPTVSTERTIPRTTTDCIFTYCLITAISVLLGLYLGAVSGYPIKQEPTELETEEPSTDESTT